MSTTFVTSDLHVGHRNQAVRRGFASVQDHDAALIEKWNITVRHDADIVWVLGDVWLTSPRNALPVLQQLRGRKRLIAGNHDACWGGHRDAWRQRATYLQVFEAVLEFARVRVSGREVLLSHFPYSGDHTPEDRFAQYRLRDEGMWLLHGHTHTTAKFTGPRQLHVGLDAWNMRPVPLHVTGKMIAEAEQNIASETQ
jgi:calcineurin-like phosphoesterase family protein